LSNIPFEDFGGEGEVLHFAHANGYPPSCYRQLLLPLTEHYRVLGMHLRPMWSKEPPTSLKSWETLAEDLIAFLEGQGLKKVIGVGHSLGAVTTMFAAVKRPDLFSKLVLLEPVFLPPKVIFWGSFVPRFMRGWFLPFIPRAKNRTHLWDSREEVFTSYRNKKVFSHFSDEVLRDFVEHGLEEKEGGKVGLVYPREWEAHIYSFFPGVWKPLKTIELPILGVRGEKSDTIFPHAWAFWKAHYPGHTLVEFPDSGHLVPLEYPQKVVEQMLSFLAE